MKTHPPKILSSYFPILITGTFALAAAQLSASNENDGLESKLIHCVEEKSREQNTMEKISSIFSSDPEVKERCKEEITEAMILKIDADQVAGGITDAEYRIRLKEIKNYQSTRAVGPDDSYTRSMDVSIVRAPQETQTNDSDKPQPIDTVKGYITTSGSGE